MRTNSIVFLREATSLDYFVCPIVRAPIIKAPVVWVMTTHPCICNYQLVGKYF